MQYLVFELHKQEQVRRKLNVSHDTRPQTNLLLYLTREDSNQDVTKRLFEIRADFCSVCAHTRSSRAREVKHIVEPVVHEFGYVTTTNKFIDQLRPLLP
jgi:hypothetical protein